MRWLGMAEAFGGSWAHSVRGWLALLVPSTVLVILQEADTPFPHFGLILLSAAIQHCCAGLAVLPLIAMLRRRSDVLPAWAAIAGWTLGALARASAGAAVAAWLTDADIDFGNRLIAWLLIAWTWMPLLSYAVAQLEHRQLLLAAQSEAFRRRDEVRNRRDRTAEQIRIQLVSDVSAATTSVIEEIETALEASRHRLTAERLELVGDRVADVSVQARQAAARLSQGWPDEAPSAPLTAAPMLAALNFQRNHPWRWSILSAVALGAIMLPISSHVGGTAFLLQLVVTLAVSSVTLATASRFATWGDHINARKAVAWSAARHAIAGLAGASALAVMRWGEFDAVTVVLLLVLPYGAAVAAEVVSAAVGVTNANHAVLDSIAAVDSDRHRLEETALENENRVRQELHDVIHGPILGRLSSCAMALNFLATESGTVPGDRAAAMTAAVLDHLGQVLNDLSALKS